MKKPHKAKPRTGHKKAAPAAARRRTGASGTRRSGAPKGAPKRVQQPRQTTITAASRLVRAGQSARLAVADTLAAGTAVARRTAGEIKVGLTRLGTGTRAAALSYSQDEREALALLFLPFLLIASAIVVHQSVRSFERYIRIVAVETEVAPVRIGLPERQAYAGLPPSAARQATPERIALAPVASPETSMQPSARAAEALAAAAAEQSAETVGPALLSARPVGLKLLAPDRLPRSTIPLAASPDRLASLAPLGPAIAPRGAAPDVIEALELGEDGKPVPRLCVAEARPQKAGPATPAEARSLTPEAFGIRLAEAAQSQVGSFVVYTDDYRSISYPLGDVNPFFGVCTDVVVRAYRAMGLDLQALVHEARVGRGDPSIDHRRTEVLRRFFEREGESLPVTSFAEDYRPGDIVTYYRPQNRHTRSHIAIVSNVIAPSGRPMIVHNRGWGPALEDALFVDEITGHYRYRGPRSDPAEPSAQEARLTGAPASSSVVMPAAFAAPAN